MVTDIFKINRIWVPIVFRFLRSTNLEQLTFCLLSTFYMTIPIISALIYVIGSQSFRIKRQNDAIFFPDDDDGVPPFVRPRPPGSPIPQRPNNRPGGPNGNLIVDQGQIPNSTPASNNGRTTPTAQFLRCMKQCPTTTEYNPVCGSDQIQYHNRQRLQCANRCGASELSFYLE